MDSSKKAAGTTNDAGKAVNDQFEMISSMNGAALRAFADSTQACMTGLQSVGSEVSSFVSERLQYDNAFVKSISGCSDWAEITSLQQDWIRQTTGDYLAETRKLVDMSSELVGDSWKNLVANAPLAGKAGR